MRLLYAGNHPTLRESDLRILLDSGFEVVPTLFHIQFRGHFRIDPRASDDPLRPINREWKAKTTLDPVTVEKIQKVNLYRITDLPFTYCMSEVASGDSTFMFAGQVSQEEQALLNEHFDVIVVQSFPSIVPRLLEWFKGIVIFRVFGNEQPGFSVWNWYKSEHYIENRLNWFLKGQRYISANVFKGIEETERPEILGQNPMTLHSVIQEVIANEVGKNRWIGDGDSDGNYIATNISYLDHSKSWQNYYEEFKAEFDGLPFRVFGKNDLSAPYCQLDPRIQPFIAEADTYLSKYAGARVFCNIGRLKQHSQYTPFECVALGVPTLFLETSAIGYELKSMFPAAGDELREGGMVKDLAEMRLVAEQCLKDKEVGRSISNKQRDLFLNCFGYSAALKQGEKLFEKCEALLRAPDESMSVELNQPSRHSKHRMLWAFAHKANRNEELPVWLDAGLEVVPMKMPSAQAAYQGHDYDDESAPDYPKWRERCTLSFLTVEYLREALDPYLTSKKRIPKHIIKHLNDHFGYVYIPALYSMAANLLLSGYTGILLVRYFGHYRPGMTLAKFNWPILAPGIGMLPQYFFLPALHEIPKHESRWSAPTARTFYVPYLRRDEKVIKTRWSAELSEPLVVSVMSALSTELNHYYRNFIKYFGQFPYRIYGKNRHEDLEKAGIRDQYVGEQVAREEDLHEKLARARVYIDPGLVDHHCHYTVIETILMEIPSLFWSRGGVANELKTKFSTTELKSLGMFDTWEEIAAETQQLLFDPERARSLSLAQREIHAFIKRDQVLESMRKVIAAGDDYFARQNSLDIRAQVQLAKILIRTNLLIFRVPMRIIRVGRQFMAAARLSRTLFRLTLVYAGLREDQWGLRMKMQRFLQSRGLSE